MDTSSDMAINFGRLGNVDGLIFTFTFNCFIIIEPMGVLEPGGLIEFDARLVK